MSIASYYLSQSGYAICADCAEQDEIESGKPLKERKNDTGDVLECTGCREDIPFVGQAYKARPSLTAEQWDELLDPDGLSKEGRQAWDAYQKAEQWVPSAQERRVVNLPTPFDSGTCKCGTFVAAGNLWEHELFCRQAREL